MHGDESRRQELDACRFLRDLDNGEPDSGLQIFLPLPPLAGNRRLGSRLTPAPQPSIPMDCDQYLVELTAITKVVTPNLFLSLATIMSHTRQEPRLEAWESS